MGLLEDAIREHLELKRLRGADPSEVAREQHEALDPRPNEQPAAWTEDHVAENGGEAGAHEPADEVPGGPYSAADVTAAGESGHFSNVGQETAELDMQAVLEDPGAAAEPAASGEEDSLEWEVPARPARGERADAEQHADEAGAGAPDAPDEHPQPAGEPPDQAGDEPDEDPPEQGRLSL
jgi:hypothetical protein